MIILKNNQLNFTPLIDVVNHGEIISDLSDRIVEYILENAHQAIVSSEPELVFYVSGLAEHHHSRLTHYLNKHIFRDYSQAKTVKGSFADYPASHYWIMAGDLLIDLAISQFRDKEIFLHDDSLKEKLDCHCFICDNAKNPIYKMYNVS
ncbi:MAG: hypothetical protein V1928_01605 [Parcubacteria group bacterium]